MLDTNRNGFTLVEMLIATSLLMMTLGVVLYTFGTGLRHWEKIAVKIERQQVANMVLTRIISDIRGASEILPASNGSQLTVKIGPDNIEYRLQKGRVERAKNGFPSPLSNGEVYPLEFSYPAAKQVEVKLDNFSTHAGLRN